MENQDKLTEFNVLYPPERQYTEAQSRVTSVTFELKLLALTFDLCLSDTEVFLLPFLHFCEHGD